MIVNIPTIKRVREMVSSEVSRAMKDIDKDNANLWKLNNMLEERIKLLEKKAK